MSLLSSDIVFVVLIHIAMAFVVSMDKFLIVMSVNVVISVNVFAMAVRVEELLLLLHVIVVQRVGVIVVQEQLITNSV